MNESMPKKYILLKRNMWYIRESKQKTWKACREIKISILIPGTDAEVENKTGNLV